jgi:ribosomal protein S18 acetylase RimI-like enzyme
VTDIEITTVAAPGRDADAVRDLFLQYGESLGFNTCFGGFEQELAMLPGEYAPPRGRLLLAKKGDAAAGCVAVKPLAGGDCEIKRLFVKGHYRGAGLGRRLAEAAIAHAQASGCRRIVLDTLPAMLEARALYRALGFRPCEPYYDNACMGSDCFELKLESVASGR